MSAIGDLGVIKMVEKMQKRSDRAVGSIRGRQAAVRGLPRELRDYLDRGHRLEERRRHREEVVVYVIILVFFALFILGCILKADH